ncbi:MAG: signal peptidase I [Proteobacteria bacterium]|nr:signal peptidase I [Pseudomonadota bacterium]
MSINLALILSVLTAVSGVVVAFNRFYYQKKIEASGGSGNRAINTLIEYSRSFFPVLLFVLIIRSFIFEPFRIPSGSMMPTLLQGDYIFVKKYSYGLRWPVIDKKFFETGSPQRGDVVVFRLPSDPSINYIKRVVGLPGDTVSYQDHQLFVNGQQMPLTRHPETRLQDSGLIFIEVLDGREHEIRISRPGSRATERVYTVPEGHYFMMGDNRDNSQDSRYIGDIPETHLVGEAVRIWMHMDGLEWPAWSRIGTKIQ